MFFFKNTTSDEAFEDGKPYVVIDVREQNEWDEGHIENSLLMPFRQIENLIEEQIPDKTTKVLLYCRSGIRASYALKTIQNLGYNNSFNIGGFTDAQRLVQKYPSSK